MNKRIRKYLRKLDIFWVNSRFNFLRYRNRRRPAFFLYTDSRGLNINRKDNTYNPFLSYPGYFVRNYSVDFFICPEKHTTLIDFLAALKKQGRNYDAVICHTGIVDFSPRRQDVAKSIYQLKKKGYDEIFGDANMSDHLDSSLGVEYEGKPTINMFSLDMASQSLLPILNAIPNLIWIGCNRFVPGWEGNYFRKRPANITLVEEFSHHFCSQLANPVDLLDWTYEEVQRFTYDNIHLTSSGEAEVIKRISARLPQ